MSFNSKVCLVTGGSRGIGRGIVQRLSQDGYQVAFTFNREEQLAMDVEQQLNAAGGTVKAFQMAIEDRASVSEVIERAREHFGRPISILINNAAIAQEKPFATITDDDWADMLKINLQGPFICSQEVLPDMTSNGWGRIVNITSIGGQWGGFNQVHYAASKAALINFTQSLAKLFSHAAVTSNAIAIGLAKTDMSGDELDSEAGKKKVANIPAGRIGTIDEIAGTVSFLCSEDASYITGQTLNVNGGMYFG
jgi:NAD(P)-dependent dehydrogenase (short-subunit alcohol dehydrogenase family)